MSNSVAPDGRDRTFAEERAEAAPLPIPPFDADPLSGDPPKSRSLHSSEEVRRPSVNNLSENDGGDRSPSGDNPTPSSPSAALGRVPTAAPALPPVDPSTAAVPLASYEAASDARNCPKGSRSRPATLTYDEFGGAPSGKRNKRPQKLPLPQPPPRGAHDSASSGENDRKGGAAELRHDDVDLSQVQNNRKLCAFIGCSKLARKGGKCISHGGGTRCSVAECSKGAEKGGKCISHGGGKRCSVAECSKSAQKGGKCVSHGGGTRCSVAECLKFGLKGGKCVSHGGGTRCSVEGCSNSSKKRGKCISHGGGIHCSVAGCSKLARKGGKCASHGGGTRCSIVECSKLAQKGGKCFSHGGGPHYSVAECSKTAQKGRKRASYDGGWFD